MKIKVIFIKNLDSFSLIMQNVCIVDFGSKKTPEIDAVCVKTGRQTSSIWWNDFDDSQLKWFDGIILSGAPVLLTETDHAPYVEKFSFLKNCLVPTLGICFGHQLLGIIHGSQIFKGEGVRVPTTVEVIRENGLFKGLGKETVMMEDHTEGITLPPNFVCLARSDKYKVEAMKHISKSIYGVQFHPEVSGKEGETLLNNFLAYCD